MFMDNSSSSVSTESYYGYRPEHDNRIHSTADSRHYSVSEPGDYSVPAPGYYSVPEPINLIRSLSSGWSTTRKRSSSSPLLDQEILQTINSLLVLQSMAGNTGNKSDISKILQEIIERNKDQRIVEEENKYSSFQDSDLDWKVNKKKKDSDLDDWKVKKKKNFTDIGVIRKPMKKKKDMKFKNLSELIELKSSNYVCKECHHVFDDYRALGGHMAAHNRNKKAEEAALFRPVEDQLVAEQAVVTDREKEKKKNYACDLCSRIFSTGQALGGHKTYHRKVGDLVETQAGSDSQVTCDEENNSVFKFDLNAPPDERLWGV